MYGKEMQERNKDKRQKKKMKATLALNMVSKHQRQNKKKTGFTSLL